MFLGCGDVEWSSQPKLQCTRGAGNLLIVSAAELAGLSITKLLKFSRLMKLQMINETIYYRHRANFVFPEIDVAWQVNQNEQIEEIKRNNRIVTLGIDGQCDSPGHNATYSTVTAMNINSNKILNFRIVHVKVCVVQFLLSNKWNTELSLTV